MKCRICGADNEDYLEYCALCGELLEAEPQQENEPQTKSGESPAKRFTTAWGFVSAPAWPEPEFNARTIDEDDIPPELLNYRRVPDPKPASAYADDKAYTPPKPYGTRLDSVRQEAAGYDEDEYGFDEVPQPEPRARRLNRQAAAYEYEREPAHEGETHRMYTTSDFGRLKRARTGGYPSSMRPSRKKHASSYKSMLFYLSAAVLLVIIIIFGTVYIKTQHGGSLGAFFSSTFGGNPVTRKPEVEATTDDGKPAYIIRIYAKNGYMLRFTAGALEQEFPVTNGMIPLRIPEEVWLPDEPIDSSTLSVVPNFVLISPDLEETKVEMEPITITVPAIEMTVTSPEGEKLATDSNIIQITGSVKDVTAAVYANDQQLAVDDAGNFTGSVTLKDRGTHTITIEARKLRHQIARKVITVDFSQNAIPIQLAEGSVLRTTEATLTVNGTMEKGATLSITGDITGTPVVDSAAGTFSFVANMPEVGQYKVTVTATSNGMTSSKDFYLEHMPDKNKYIPSAHVMDYNRINEAPTHKQAYKVVGKVVEIMQETPYQLVKMNVGGKELIMEYHGPFKFTAGTDKEFIVYADPNGRDEATGLIKMYGWFIG